jgi:Heterokaryon incompatibility protein (HET)
VPPALIEELCSGFAIALEAPDRGDTQQHDRIFDYKPINGDIRLVTLEHGVRKDAVRCKMFDVELSTKPTYLALSYEWGRIGESSMIWIDEGLCKVCSSLFNALVHIRKPNEDLVLWVDALCINQQNLGERNHQVELMGKIFLQATEVVIWLGLARDDSDLAMKQFKEISQSITLGKPVGRPMMRAEAILSWCRRTYWRRMWVIQEIQLAKSLSIYCGEESIMWAEFASARQWVIKFNEPFESEREAYEAMISSLPARMDDLRSKARARHTPLIEWLETFENSLFTDPKDKVYALIGLASDCQKGELSVDCSKSLSQIWLDVVKLYLSREISKPGGSTADTANLLYLSNCLFKWLNMDLSWAVDEMRLPKEKIWVRGIYCCSIAILGPEYQVTPMKASQVQVGLRNKPVYISSKRLCSVRPANSGATASRGIFGTIYESLFRDTKIPAVSGEQLLLLGSDQWPTPGGLNEKTFGLRTAITVLGETFLVPPTTQHDDIICILPECDIALIFRKLNQWTLEGLGVYSMAERRPAQGEAVHVCLDILTLEKVTAAAEFESSLDRKAPWRHSKMK